MFDISRRATFVTKVTVHVPDGEGHREETFRATFEAIGQEEQDELALLDRTGEAFLKRVWRNAEDVVGADGKPVPFEEAEPAMLDLPYVRFALTMAYLRAISGAKSGN